MRLLFRAASNQRNDTCTIYNVLNNIRLHRTKGTKITHDHTPHLECLQMGYVAVPVEIQYNSIAYFERITEFDVL